MPLTKPVPAGVRQTMRTAFDNLERSIAPQDSRDFHSSTLQSVRQEALDIENQLASRQSLRNMRRLMPLFTALEHYSSVVDILCNGTPFLPWIWAPITLILRISCEYIEAFDMIIRAYSRIAESMPRFQVLEETFAGDARFFEILAAFYADILEFHKHAYSFVRRSGWKLLFRTSWGRFQRRFDNIIDDIKRHEDLIDKEANARDIAEARNMRQELETWRRASLEQIDYDAKEQTAREFHAVRSWLRVDDSDQRTTFESIADHGNKYSGTCGWILKNTKIRSWLQPKPDTPMLWLSGTAGSGKSVISTQLIKFMQTSVCTTVLHHFCINTSPKSSEYEQVLKSLLEQLLRRDSILTGHVYDEYVLKKQSTTLSQFEQLFLTLLTSYSVDVPCVWIIIDGADELREDSPNSQSRMLSLMKQLISKTSAPGKAAYKVLISSRSSSTISRAFHRKPTISLTDEKESLNAAIEEYSMQRLRLLHTRLEQLGLDAREMHDIGLQITRKADGMFLYARLVLDYISNNVFIRGDELKDSIHNLPRELSEFYQKILAQILAPVDSNSKKHIQCILGWIAYARRPLRKFELLSALAFSSGNTDVELPAPEYVVDICSSLVEERSDNTLSFIHASVKSFLQSSLTNLILDQESALHQHCLASVTCLLSSIRLVEEDRQQACRLMIKGVYGIQIYSVEHWTDYVLCVADQKSGLDIPSGLHDQLCLLSERLTSVFGQPSKVAKTEDALEEPRLRHLKRTETVYELVRAAIRARSLKQLEEDLKQENGLKQAPSADGPAAGDHETGAQPQPPECVSALLSHYQGLINYALHEVEIPGVSSQELERFRHNYRTSSYTCRLRCCPRATAGFESEKLRIDHELSHIRRYRCEFPSCQYPPFLSSRALRTHTRQKHELAAPRKSIRRVTRFTDTRDFTNSQSRAAKGQDKTGAEVGLRASNTQRNPALQDYQLQLYFLEIENKRRPSHDLQGQETREPEDSNPDLVGQGFPYLGLDSKDLELFGGSSPSNLPKSSHNFNPPDFKESDWAELFSDESGREFHY